MTQGDNDSSTELGLVEPGGPSSNVSASGGTGRWRLGGISTRTERDAWLRCGVFDAHRAGLLRAAGLTPADVEGLLDDAGRAAGHEFALGRLGCAELLELVSRRRGRRAG